VIADGTEGKRGERALLGAHHRQGRVPAPTTTRCEQRAWDRPLSRRYYRAARRVARTLPLSRASRNRLLSSTLLIAYPIPVPDLDGNTTLLVLRPRSIAAGSIAHGRLAIKDTSGRAAKN
jgi:hypothetical protein